MPKISALTSLAQASVDTAADVLPIVDATAPATTKKVTVQAMVNAGLATLTTLPSGIVNASISSITPTGGTLDVVGAAQIGGNVRIDGRQLNLYPGASVAYEIVNRDGGGYEFFVGGVTSRLSISSAGASVTGSISATGNITSAGNVIQVGAAGTGTGGNFRITDDGGTLRWLAGLLGTAGARDWTLLEVVSGRTPIRANASTGAVSIDHGLSVTGTATAASFVGPLTGNASTATTLATARNINGVSFNGSADITVTAAAGTLTGTTLAANVVNASLNSITPVGGTLDVVGAAQIGGNVRIDGRQLNLYPGASVAYEIVNRDGGGYEFFVGGVTSRLSISSAGASVTGSISATTRVNYPSYTVATLPAVGTAGGNIYVSDESGGAQPAFSDGANWRRYTDRAIVS